MLRNTIDRVWAPLDPSFTLWRLRRLLKTSIFRDITPCSPLKLNRYFGGTSRLHLPLLATCFHAGFLLGLFFYPEDGGDMFLRNISWLPTDYTLLATCFHTGFLLGLYFYPEDGGDMFLRNISWLPTDYTLLAICFHAGFLLSLFFTLKMEAIFSSETSVDFHQTTRRYIPEDGTLHNHRCDNLKSYMKISGMWLRVVWYKYTVWAECRVLVC
jgi:uncharacterized membrane protein YciS (DUF1049 family)